MCFKSLSGTAAFVSNMWYFNLLVLCAISAVHGKSVVRDENDEPALEWPSTYSFEAERIYLEAGFTEEYQMWRTPKTSRIDYNNGVVKSIVDKSKSSLGYKYKIHPVADDNGDSSSVCEMTKGRIFKKLSLEDILPDTDSFDKIGTESIRDLEATKFYFVDDSEQNIQTRKTIWAVYNSSEELWEPLRYEVENYNTWIGSQDKHEIWEFYNFVAHVDKSYFNTDELCKEPVEISIKDELVTKHLLFMNPENDHHVDHVFQAFKKKYNRIYDVDGEHAMRRTIFKRNMRLIATTNQRDLGYKLAINQFSDRTPQEMKRHTGRQDRPVGQRGTISFPYTSARLKEIAEELPEEYDARLYGLVGTVKNQLDCGSCWTFGTTVAMEGAIAKANLGKFVTLSNQAILDCAWPFGASGCDGGSDTAAYGWLIENGQPTQAEYGDYANTEGNCHIKNMTNLYKIKGFVDVIPNSIEALKVALINHGPMSTSINANAAVTQYSGGIFYDEECDPSILNHEVGLVGYGEKDGETFWIIKNSWGPEWGIDGYMHISARNNNCGAASEPSYVVV